MSVMDSSHCVCGFNEANPYKLARHKKSCRQYHEYIRGTLASPAFQDALAKEGVRVACKKFGFTFRVYYLNRRKPCKGEPCKPETVPIRTEPTSDQVVAAIESMVLDRHRLKTRVQDLEAELAQTKAKFGDLQKQLTHRIALDVMSEQSAISQAQKSAM